jgi:hypothetical protein
MISGWSRTSRVNRLMAVSKFGLAGQSAAGSVLESRGWTLQEDLLSLRVLHCTDGGLAWSCLRGKCSESDPGWDLPQPNWITDTKYALARSTDVDRHNLDTGTIFGCWADLVASYTKRNLSQPSDKLIAVSGLQRRFGACCRIHRLQGDGATRVSFGLCYGCVS